MKRKPKKARKFLDFSKNREHQENAHSFIAIKGNQHLAKALCEILHGHRFRENGRRENAIVANVVRARDADLHNDFCWARLK
jgi:hypothetical protein